MPTNTSVHLTPKTGLGPAITAWEMYLTDQGRSPNTVKAFLSDVRLLTQFLPADRKLGDITTNELNKYFEWMEKERAVPCSPKTLARRITSTKSFFRWLHQYGVLVIDPAEKVLQRSAISPLPLVLTQNEMDAALLAADRHRRDHKPDARPYTNPLELHRAISMDSPDRPAPGLNTLGSAGRSGSQENHRVLRRLRKMESPWKMQPQLPGNCL